MRLNIFREVQFLPALKSFFKELNVPINYVADEPTTANEILQDTYKDNETFKLINDVYFVGMVDDAAFRGEDSIDSDNIKSDYDGILIFGITLHQRPNNLLPTRSQLAEITRAFNREFYYTPVALVFKYKNEEKEYIAFSNAERLKYKQEWREGEKAGKVSLLRDIDILKTHAGHEKIINELQIQTTGLKAVDSFDKLYKYWQDVFNVSILNKKFYQELQSWFFWAIKEVTFPNPPNRFDYDSDAKFDDAIKEHKGKNVIRLLTRLLFIWFIKEKKLVPEEIFDENYVADNLIKDFTPQKPHGVFATGKHTSMYYRAILQNLFFATLNQEMGKREFRKPKKHMNVSNLMRYQDYFKDGGDTAFLNLMNAVPFMNGGLFECLDKPHPDKKGKRGGDIIIYEDGFSDRNDNLVEVPDFLFFDVDEEVDISDDIGSRNKIFKQAKTRGLLEILKSYKFTITENTPIEEDVALDPELLGKVFENLLASYNPETKTTARKQTGSFYTPREIVNYMVDESLIAYLKNTIKNWGSIDEEQLDKDLHTLVAFDNPQNPFESDNELQNQIIKALDNCRILDPACGSGAFPMGVLQKMAHILYKVDPNNTEWKHRQLLRVDAAIQSLEEIDDVEFREKSVKELEQQKTDIDEAFRNNELDFGRKLHLIENCIYGVDIQSIAAQISKLRFFISLVVDQKIDKTKANFGVRPLPNLETKFVAANTLIGIEKPEQQGNLFDNEEVKKLEDKLKKIRHKLFSSKSPIRKRELREEDKILREQIAGLLKNNGWRNETARQLASWDPYDQNSSSPFFDPEWMFDVPNEFNIIIGNPPYIGEKGNKEIFRTIKKGTLKNFYKSKMDIFYFFYHVALNFTNDSGIICFITTNYFVTADSAIKLRNDIKSRGKISIIINFNEYKVFDSALGQHNAICQIQKQKIKESTKIIYCNKKGYHSPETTISILNGNDPETTYSFSNDIFSGAESYITMIGSKDKNKTILELISKNTTLLSEILYINSGCDITLSKVTQKHLNSFILDAHKGDGVFVLDKNEFESLMPKLSDYERKLVKSYIKCSNVGKYRISLSKDKLLYIDWSEETHNIPNLINHLKPFKKILDDQKDRYNEPAWPWYSLHRPRELAIFENTEKIIVPYRSNTNLFAHYKLPVFSSRDVFFLTKKKATTDIYFLLGLLNSKLIYFWLYHKGKRKGGMLELYATPLSNIPIKMNNNYIEHLISILVQISIKNKNYDFDNVINALVFNLYFKNYMEARGLAIQQFVGNDIKDVIKDEKFELLNIEDSKRLQNLLVEKWNNSNNEIFKIIKQLSKESPDILKPILEG